jgi:uncharacterized protein YjbI with pentapeptide repeats
MPSKPARRPNSGWLERMDAARRLRGIDLRFSDLSHVSLKCMVMVGADLSRSEMYNTQCHGADLTGAHLFEVDARRASFYKARLDGADMCLSSFLGTEFRSASMRGAKLRAASLQGCDLTGADLRDCDLRQANFHGARLRGADLRGSRTNGMVATSTDFVGANLNGMDLRGVSFVDARDLPPMGRNPSAEERNRVIRSDILVMKKTSMASAYLICSDLGGSYLAGCNLAGANLSGADMESCDLSGANLDGADLTEADLSSADLSGASILSAKFYEYLSQDGAEIFKTALCDGVVSRGLRSNDPVLEAWIRHCGGAFAPDLTAK